MKITTDNSKMCEEFLASVLGLALHFLSVARFDRKNPQQLFSICMYSRLVELSISCKALLEKNALTGIPVLTRSIFEADISLTNLILHTDHYKRLYANFLDQKIRFTKGLALSKTNAILMSIKESINADEVLLETKAELDKLKVQKHGPISIKEGAELANKFEDYLAHYSSMSVDSHNNIRSLELWNVDGDAEGEYQVAVFNVSKEDLLGEVFFISRTLLQQTKALSLLLKLDDIEFDKYFLELDRVVEKLNLDE